jgi:hypothetical protein
MGNDKPISKSSASTKRWWSPVIVAIGATVAAVLSHSPVGTARVDADSASTWLLSTGTRFLGRTNALISSPQVATTARLALSVSPAATAEQRGTTLIVDDPGRGTATMVDLRTLRQTTVPMTGDARVEVAGERTYLLEPRTGRVGTVPDGATVVRSRGGAFGKWTVSAGSLWVTVPAEGTVLRIGPSAAAAIDAFPPGHTPLLAGAPAGVALLDGRTLAVIHEDGAVSRHRVAAGNGPAAFGLSPDGGTAVVRSGTTLEVTRLSDDRSMGSASLDGPADRWGGLVVRRDAAYLADDTTGALWSVRTGPTVALRPPIDVAGHGAALNLFADGALVWANDPAGPYALAVDDAGRSWPVTKYRLASPAPEPTRTTAGPKPTPTTPPPAEPTHPPSSAPTRSSGPDRTAKPKSQPKPGPKARREPRPKPRPTPVTVRATFGALGTSGAVGRCEQVHLSVSLPRTMTLLIAVRRTHPASNKWYFNYAGSRDCNVTSHSTTVYFGSAENQRYRAVLLAMEVEDARTFYNAHNAGDFAVSTSLPSRARQTDQRSVTQTSIECSA